MTVGVTKPRMIAFEVTRKCKLNCMHCRAAATEKANREYMTTAQCKEILLALGRYNKCVVILTGGEPTERDDIYELIEYGNSTGHRMAMATCGYSINDDTAKKLKDCKILTLSFSLDGSDAASHDSFRRVPGAFEIALAAIEKCRKYGIKFQINTTVANRNIDQIPQIAHLAQKLGAYCFNPFILVPTGRGSAISDEVISPVRYEKLLSDLAAIKKENPMNVRVTCGPQFSRMIVQTDSKGLLRKKKPQGCTAGGEFAFINYRGDVQTCGFLNIPAGNLIDNGYDFADIWQNSKLLNEIRDLSLYQGKCGQCEFIESCRGCRARAYATTGNYLASDPICNYKQALTTE